MEAVVGNAEELGTKESTKNSAADAMRSLSRLAYTTAYVCSYGVTYAGVFIANALPSENAIMRGFSEGARAAIDALETK
ncbi:MAG: hypothetical protein ACLPH3_06015 [Terracidiphilus sp.]